MLLCVDLCSTRNTPFFFITIGFPIFFLCNVVLSERNSTQYNELKLLRGTKNNRNRQSIAFQGCSDFCWDGNNCNAEACRGCFFSCRDGTCPIRQTTCKNWCVSDSDCSKSQCRGCLFCQSQNNSGNQNCQLVTFKEQTSAVFSKTKPSWNQWLHSGRPYFHENAPVFFEMNDGDNSLAYFNSMHSHKFDGMDKHFELGISDPSVASSNNDVYSLKRVFDRIICTDERCVLRELFIDPHGQVIADLDGDGSLDLLISNGGGNDEILSPRYSEFDSWLFWGEPDIDAVTGEEITIFKGGRDAAKTAGVHMRIGRSRFNYLLDLNGDGLLDIFTSQDRRVSNKIRPGILLINQGDRTWKKDENVMEYAPTLMVTDADGDGYARELFINRGFCYPQRNGPEHDQSFPTIGPYSNKVKVFCHTRPVGTNAILSFDKETGQTKEISKQFENFWPAKSIQRPCCPNGIYNGDNDCNAQSMSSGDFDRDQIADHVLLYNGKIVFYFSTDRPKGALPDNPKFIGLEIQLPSYCQAGRSLRIVDIDNDGKEEILVMCKNAGAFLLYTRGTTKTSWTLQNGCNEDRSLGDLNNLSLTRPTVNDMNSFCQRFTGSGWKIAETACIEYTTKGRLPATAMAGVSIIDLNNDGFLDIVYTSEFGYLRFFYNKPSVTSSSNRFISFKLRGNVNSSIHVNNIYGIGATIILVSRASNGQLKWQFRENSSFQHHTDRWGSKEDRIIFGLGTHLTPVRVIAKWPSGYNQRLNLDHWRFTPKLEPIDIIDRGDKQIFTLKSKSPGVNSDEVCIGVGEKMQWGDVISHPCSASISNQWFWDVNGRLVSNKYPSHCLRPSSTDEVGKPRPLRLYYCQNNNNVSWFFTSDGQIQYKGSKSAIGVETLAFGEKIQLVSMESQFQVVNWIRESV